MSNEDRDPALGSGLGYFVEDTAYRAHLARFVNEDEVRLQRVLCIMFCADTSMYRLVLVPGWRHCFTQTRDG